MSTTFTLTFTLRVFSNLGQREIKPKKSGSLAGSNKPFRVSKTFGFRDMVLYKKDPKARGTKMFVAISPRTFGQLLKYTLVRQDFKWPTREKPLGG